MSELKAQITEAMKEAMRSREKERLSAIRLILSEIKRIEVDERIELDDARVLAILDKMTKQRRDSITQYMNGGRPELAAVEEAEIAVIAEFLPTPLTEAEIDQLIDQALVESGAEGMQAMGKVMAILKPKLQGRADMSVVSGQIKKRLG